MATITICICTRNRREELKRCLNSIVLQEGLEAVTEVLVIDNASTDSTSEWLESEMVDSFPVLLRVLRESQVGISFARNRAFRESQSEALLWVDDDVTLRPGFIEAHAQAFGLSDTALTGGRIFPLFPEDTADEIRGLFDLKYGGPAAGYDFGDEARVIGMAEGELDCMPIGANFGVLKSAIAGSRPFDESLGWGKRWIPGEETDLFIRLMGEGRVGRYVPEAIVDHHLRAERLNLDYYLKWWSGQGRSEVHMIKRHRYMHALDSLTSCIKLSVRHRFTKDPLVKNAILGQLVRAQGRFQEALSRGE